MVGVRQGIWRDGDTREVSRGCRKGEDERKRVSEG